MSEQSRGSSRRRDHETEETTVASGVGRQQDAGRQQERDADVDALLDEIDGVLEVNAEEFVRSFVQKGGQ